MNSVMARLSAVLSHQKRFVRNTAHQLRARLFQPFSAGDSRSGSGLGLAICAEIVQALGGLDRVG